MLEDKIIASPYNDYAQSANTLFHFMSRIGYLESLLKNRAIIPRYCRENIEYLNINNGKHLFKEVAVLQKCFCDIPFHKLTYNFELKEIGEECNSLTAEEKSRLSKTNTHPDYYGRFAIAFSKEWGEKNNLQPVMYLNEHSSYKKDFTELLNKAINEESIPDEYVNDVLNRLAFMKPLRGTMNRNFERDDNKKNLNINLHKNFHDEKEWRYVPNSNALSETTIERVIANPKMIELYFKSSMSNIVDINKKLETEKYRPLWLEYNYHDIRYIIVEDFNDRIKIINTIMDIPNEQFYSEQEVLIQKYILISKILVLEEIRKDW